MAYTALDLITDTLVDLGVLADEETPTDSQAQGGLRKLNNMLEDWNIQSFLVYGATSDVFPLISNQGTYTIGTGGNFNIPRPNNIVSAAVRDISLPAANRLDYALDILNDMEYQDIALKGLTTNLPMAIYFDNQFPLMNAYLYPIPSTTQYSLVLWTSGIISSFALTDTVALAPGYKRAIMTNLCLELAPSYGAQAVQVAEAMRRNAKSAKDNLKVQNFQLTPLTFDDRLGPQYWNYLTGYFGRA
jgi:hypothetical protein